MQISSSQAKGQAKRIIDGRYRIIESIGSGRTSTLYKAEDTLQGGMKALKFLKLKDRGEYLLFNQEFLNLKKLQHPNLIEVYDFGQTEQERVYFTMELLSSVIIPELWWMSDNDGFLQFALVMMDALGYLHAAGWLHRDVKTANVLLADPEDPRTGKLTDFGFARLNGCDDRGRTGTLEYMAPEVLFGEQLDQRCDLYSAGIMLYEIWTGGFPFATDSAESVIKAKAALKSPFALEAASAIPGKIRGIIEKLIQPDPIFRYCSAEEVVEDILTASKGRLVLATGSTGQSNVRLLNAAFSGRSTEIERLQAGFEDLSERATPSCLSILGKGGIGKTRLINEFKQLAQVGGGKVVTVCCEDCAGGALGPVRRLFAQLMPEGQVRRDSTLSDIAPEALALLPGTRSELEPAVVSNEETLFEGIRRLLARATQGKDHVLVLEDLHLADPELWRLVVFLERSLKDCRYMLIVSLDPDSLKSSGDETAAGNLGALKEAGDVIVLEPLAAPDAGRLISSSLGLADLPDEFRDWVAARSGCVPARILAGLRRLVEEGSITRRRGRFNIEVDGFDLSSLDWNDDTELAYPPGSVEGLDANALHVMADASILGRSFTLELLDCMLGGKADQLLHAVGAAQHAGLIRADEHEPGRYSFVSNELTATLSAYLTAARSKKLHRMAAKALEARGAPASTLAAHCGQGAQKAKAYRFAMAAARESASLRAFHDAKSSYAMATSMCGTGAKWRERKLKALSESGSVLETMGNFDEAANRYARMLRLLNGKDADAARVKRVTRQYAWAMARTGNLEEGERIVNEALKRDDAPTVDTARLLQTLALMKNRRGSWQVSVELCEKALGILAGAGGDPEAETAFRSTLAAALMRMGRYEEAIEQNNIAIRTSEAIKDLPRMSVGLNNLGCIYWSMGQWTDARSAFLELLECLKQQGNLPSMSSCYTNIGLTSYQIGEWDEALECHSKALGVSEQLGDKPGLLRGLNNLGILHRDRGDYDKAKECLERAKVIALEAQDRAAMAVIEGNLGDLALRAGDYDKASRHYRKDLAIAKEINLTGELIEVHRRLAEVELAAGSPDNCLMHCENGLALLSQSPCDLELGIIQRILAGANLKRGELTSAQRYLAASLRILRKAGNLYEVARTELSCAAYAKVKKQYAKAERWIARAQAIFEKVRALEDLEAARKATQEIQKESRARDRSKWEMLLKAGLALNEILDLDRLLALVMDMVLEVTQAKRGFLMLRDEDGKLKFELARGELSKDVQGEFAISSSIVDQVSRTRRAVVVTDISESEVFRKKESILFLGIKSMMCVPLLSRGSFIGLIYVDNRDETVRVFNEEDLSLFEALSGHAAIAIENAKLISALNNSFKEIQESKAQLETAYQALKDAQCQLIQAEKMSAMGQIASSIAHELNQPLSAILGYSEVLLYQGKLASEPAEMLRIISKESMRMSKLVSNIRNFSRKASAEFSTVDIHEAIREVLALVNHTLAKRRVRLECRLDQEPLWVSADGNQLQQVFLNLITNGIDALAEAESKQISIATAKLADHKVEVVIADTGCGIPEEIKSDIFNPFFTTKPEGKGTGLGLSIILGIIKNHNGSITVESAAGRGSTFRVHLPAAVTKAETDNA